MKKILALLLVLCMTLSLAACGGKKEEPATTESVKETEEVTEEPAEESAEAKTIKVGVAIYKFDDNFMTVYREELQRYFEEDMSKDGVTYEVTVVDGKNDQAEQTNQIQNFIASGVDVIVANLVQSSAAASVINLCKDADIPVVFINREPTADDLALWDKVAYVGADARQSGTFQGEIINETPNKGDFNGDGKINYVMVVGDPENVDAKYRTEFSIKAVTDSGMQVEKLVEQRGDWDQAKGQEIVAQALTQYGKDVEVVFCNNDAMALGAYQAIEAAGRKVGEDIYLVGVDALDEAVAYVNEGKMTGTVLNDANGQSHKAAEVAALVVNGEAIEKNYTVDYVKVIKK
ncbi:methyl-galactoside transport system substrate-binding protein [Mobilisporobacter senegalensis]|uniref:D-galactose/methyl-galactoside binding periplasmic protein MglB n=1 Tax=Mobilisporobacter senegalensis TaxID=1329262 RepID=A0A3N1XZJ3_9FIRM|nr:galactose ABC transporter substrate-binding protein [Mobilisporobacter senegalensis]ROR31708.1 methyl-galactoside transport system substrate-binding protein [Mobilisporobacter senegalensis]